MSPFKTRLIFIILAIAGALVIPRFTVDLNPSYQLPRLTITFQLPDSPPEIVEQDATAPLENALSQINQLKNIYSISGEGHGTIELTFDRDADMDFKRFEVASAVRQLYPKLHSQLTYPIIEQRSREIESRKPLLIYRINAALAPFQIRKTVKDLFEADLSQLEGIKSVEVNGAQGLQITIAYNYNKIKQYGISTSQIRDAINKGFSTDYPGFTKTASGQKILVAIKQPLTSLAQIENLVIPLAGSHVYLKDIAKVYVEESKADNYFRINGLNSISLVIYASDGVNRLTMAQNANQLINAISENLPSGYQFQLQYDDTQFIAAELNKNYIRSGLAIAILFIFILFAYRSWKHLVILLAGLLVNLLITALVAFFLGISIHLYTLAGIAISFGMMIDNLIIMLDHLKRKKSRKVFRAIIGATLTTVMALLIVLLLPEEERNNLSEFAVIISIALVSSILVSSLFIPAMQFAFGHLESDETQPIATIRKRVMAIKYYSSTLAFLARYRKTFIIGLMLAFGLPVFLLPTKWEGQDWYNQSIGSDFYQESIRPYIDPALGGALRPFVRNVYERGGFRELERTKLYVKAELPYGNTLEEMDRIIRAMENYLKSIDGVENFVATIHSGLYAVLEISFKKEFENGSLPYNLKNQLIARSLDWSGVGWNIYGVGQGFSNNASNNLLSYRVEMRGYNYNNLEVQAAHLATKLLAHPRIQQVNTNERLAWNEKPSQQWSLDLSTNPGILAKGLTEVTGDPYPSAYVNWNDERFPVLIQSQDGNLGAFEMMNDYLASDKHTWKLASSTSLTLKKTSSSIHKENRQYIRIVGFEYYGSDKFGNDYLTKVLDEIENEMPPGYTAKKAFWDWGWLQIKRQYGLLLLLVIGVYFLGSILFENLRQPLYVIMSIPLAFIGLFLAFSLGSFYFDQGGYAAFILLGGIAVNASIFIINDLNNMSVRNYNHDVVKAVTGKMKPILLTVVSTCLGLTPFLIGGQNEIFWFSLAIGTIGGLIVSIPVFALVIPVMLWKI